MHGIPSVCLLLWIVTLSLLSSKCNGVTYYVRPNFTTPCPSEPCHVLNFYVHHNTFNTSNTRFVFLPGNHTLNTTIVVENVENLKLTGDDRFETGPLGLPAPSSQIHCNRVNGTGFDFANTSNLIIKKILFMECVHEKDVTNNSMSGALTMQNTFNSMISRVTIQESPGCGIVAVNLFGSITDSIFLISNNTLAHFERYNRDIHKGHPTLVIELSRFLKGLGVTAAFIPGVSYSTPTPNTYYPLTFKNCTFQGNSAVYSSTVSIKYHSDKTAAVPCHLHVALFENCTFLDSEPPAAMYKSIIYSVTILTNSNVTFFNCIFEDNIGTAITVANSAVTFKGTNTFRNNSGTDGGALLFSTNSYMILQENTHIHFINNHAERSGGAIYVRDRDCFHDSPCFFQLPSVYVQSLNIKLYFENNTATFGGTALYGGLLNDCKAIHEGTIYSNTIWRDFDAISEGLHNTVLEPSTISSDPIGVCFCINNIPDCDKKWNNITIYPGQSFNISAITVGQRNGTVRGVILADIDHGTVDNLQKLQSLESYQHCTNLTYTVFSLEKSATLTVSESEYGRMCNAIRNFEDKSLSPTVYIVLQDCPAGFTITKNATQPKCDCVAILKKHHIHCDVNKGTIKRPASSWIGYYNASHENERSGVLYHPHCPIDYCKHADMNIQLNISDEQCAFNHSGTLCGSCKPRLSLALGTSQCLKCSNTCLTLLIPFGVAGLALVFLLVVCNLTVTEGTLNGLIFYANIIWVNKAIFFPSNNTTSKILTVFLAWVNLDLGVKTCFYDGMDAYGKTWLQFAFPLYIWTLVGLIIYLSRYRAVNRLIGQNAVKVLATLFLLSYTKLQRTIIAALSFTFIQYPDNSKRYVWLYDGNVDFFTGKQIPLLMAGLASLLFMSLPYTLALFFISYVRRIATPRYRLLRWIVRLLPLFDAYTAPFKPQHQFWTGFLLIVRSLLFLVFVFSCNHPTLNLMATAIASPFVLTLAWSLGGTYKHQPMNILESSFILNLGTVSVIILYTGVSRPASHYVVYASTGIAFATFVGIILYHCYKQVSKTGLWRGLRAAARSQLGGGRRGREDETEPLLPETDPPEPREGEIPHQVSYSHYRESMLENLTDSRGDN